MLWQNSASTPCWRTRSGPENGGRRTTECLRLFHDCFRSRRSASPAINRVRLSLPVISLCSLRILMALLGPMVVVAEAPATELLDAIGKAGGFPVIEANWA